MVKPRKRRLGRPRDEALLQRRREQILDAATVVFAAYSYHSADVQWIADRLKLSKASVYRYFGSKEKLFRAAVDRGVARLVDQLAASGSGETDPRARLSKRIAAYL